MHKKTQSAEREKKRKLRENAHVKKCKAQNAKLNAGTRNEKHGAQKENATQNTEEQNKERRETLNATRGAQHAKRYNSKTRNAGMQNAKKAGDTYHGNPGTQNAKRERGYSKPKEHTT